MEMKGEKVPVGAAAVKPTKKARELIDELKASVSKAKKKK